MEIFYIYLLTEPTIHLPALHAPVLKSKPGMPCWIHHAQVPWGQGSFNQISDTPLH